MKLFQRIFFAAVLAGLAASLAMSAVQQWRVTPLILEAELYETAEPAAADAGHAHETAAPAHAHDGATPAHEHDADAWAPQDGVERTFYTVLANVLGGIGYIIGLGGLAYGLAMRPRGPRQPSATVTRSEAAR